MTEEEKNEYDKSRFWGWIDKVAGEYWQDDQPYNAMHSKVMNFMRSSIPTIKSRYKDLRSSIKRNLFI